ncbi:MAG: glycoside hydrolase [Gammaproteobacteria bacterium]|nr:glycoside hydrolase [Gammaproteobacteria bacterium]MBU1481643.1 glycoside hydrolase [Gammaproteobacteria bacterium]
MQQLRKSISGLCAFGAILLLAGCGGGSSADTLPPPERITFAGVGAHGIFDPSVARDPASGRIWMSYSAVDPSALWPTQNIIVVATRLAYSDDNGKTWTDSGAIISDYLDVTIPLAAPDNAGTWVNEVSQLVYDPGATPNERWKILWHHYLLINNVRHFEHGWLGMKMAGTPEGLAAAQEVKLFAGNLYNSDNDTQNGITRSPLGGAPLIHLDTELDPALNTCLFSEPGMYASGSALYLSVLCVKYPGFSHSIALLKCDSPCTTGSAASWSYLGTVLQDSDAAAIGFDTGFSASGLFESAGSMYLVATPVQTAGAPWPDYYSGCRVYRFSNIDSALLQTSGSQPALIGSVHGTAGSFNGACAYNASANMSGMLYSEANTSVTDIFRIYMSHQNF